MGKINYSYHYEDVAKAKIIIACLLNMCNIYNSGSNVYHDVLRTASVYIYDIHMWHGRHLR